MSDHNFHSELHLSSDSLSISTLQQDNQGSLPRTSETEALHKDPFSKVKQKSISQFPSFVPISEIPSEIFGLKGQTTKEEQHDELKQKSTSQFPSFVPISEIPSEMFGLQRETTKEEELDDIWKAPPGGDATIISEKGFINHDIKNFTFPEALIHINDFSDEQLNKPADVLALDYPETDQSYKFNRVMGQSTRGYWNDFKKRVEEKEWEYLEYGRNEPSNKGKVDLALNSYGMEGQDEKDEEEDEEDEDEEEFNKGGVPNFNF